MQTVSDISIDPAKSRPYSTCVAIETVKILANRKNDDFLLFFKPQQIKNIKGTK